MARPKKNNADYFSHDNNMRNNRKIKAIRNKFGLEGYAIFNMFLETLTECDNFEIQIKNDIDWELLSADFGIEVNKLKEIIQYCLDIELLKEEDGKYYSISLIERLEPVLTLREKKRKWANNRWKNTYNSEVFTNSKTSFSNSKTSFSNSKTMQSKVKESKVKESKVNKSKLNKNKLSIPPLKEEVKKYCEERKNNVDYEKWFNFYSAKGWMIGKNKMKDWKAAVRTWEIKKSDMSILR